MAIAAAGDGVVRAGGGAGFELRGVLAGLSLGVAGSLMVIASAGTGYGDYQLHLVGAFLRLPAFCGLGANPRMDCRGDALEGVGGLGTILLRLCDALDVQSSGALDFVARGAPDYNAKGRRRDAAGFDADGGPGELLVALF
jgi:hypothetical protein